MRAFLTGATGFLGRHLCEILRDEGWEIYAYKRASSKTQGLNFANFVEGDLFTDAEKILPDNLDAIFHIAGDTNLWKPNNKRQYRVNVELTKALIDAAIKKGVPRFIHTSSIAAFGMQTGLIDESTMSNAETKGTNYHLTKYLGQQEVLKRKDEIHVAILNPCSIMGKYDEHNWSQLFTLIQQDSLPGIPNASSSYCYVREVAKAHLTAFHKAPNGEKYILGGPHHTFQEVTERIGKMLKKDKKVPVIPAPLLYGLGVLQESLSYLTKKEPDMTLAKAKLITNHALGDSSKAVKELGYDHKIPLDKMLQECFDWLKEEKRI
jgi:dihydroflavonol-4-reductase